MYNQKIVIALMMAALLGSVVLVKGCNYSKHGRTAIAAASPDVNIAQAAKHKNVWPIVILGSGPAGLTAALYGVWNNIKTLVINGPKPGGLLTDTSKVENWPGQSNILGQEIIDNLQTQVNWIGEHFAQKNGNEVEFLEDTVVKIDPTVWPVRLETEDGQVIHALTVIVATGASPKWLEVPGEKDFIKNGVSTCATCDAGQFGGKDVIVVGGGDAAIEEAIQCARWVKSVKLMVRKDKFRASASMQAHLNEQPTIQVMFNTQIQKIMGDSNGVNKVEILNNKTNESSVMPIDGIFIAVGHTPNSQLVKDFLDVDEVGYIKVKGRSQATSIDWFFAAGDVEDHVYRQAGVASGHGIQASLDAISFLTRIGFTNDIAAQLQATRAAVAKKAVGEHADIPVISSMAQFDQVIASNQLIVIDCFKQDCPPCKKMLPIFDATSRHFASKAQFYKVDVTQVPEIAQKLHILNIPCFFVYHNGKLVARYQGTMTEKEFILFVGKFVDGSTQAAEDSEGAAA